MIRNKFLLKGVAVFFLFEIIVTVVSPTISWALTSGPTAPEATSFEPVDTTDMVNTITGDLVYNMPLLEVPGPSGGYPLSLSYHAGIQPGVDASWVGLGFTLNPGSINRIVNGVPDDFSGAQTMNHVFWEGGETTINTYGVSIGIANVASVSSGLVFASDTYRGRGVGGYASIGLKLGNTPASLNFQIGVSPYGQEISGSVGIGVGIGMSVSQSMNAGLNAQASLNTSGKMRVGASAGLSTNTGLNALGASISTDEKSATVGISGIQSSFNNSKSDDVSTRSKNFAVDIPVFYWLSIHLGRDYTRYWLSQREDYLNYGSLYFPESDPGEISTKVFDTYHLEGWNSISSENNVQKYLEGSFADYDLYSVNAQGLGGSFRPYHYAVSLSSQDVVKQSNNTKEILNYYIPQHSIGVQYRFVNDFSNRVLNEAPEVLLNQTLQNYTHPNQPEVDYQDWEGRMNSTYAQTENIPLLFPYQSVITGQEGYNNVPGAKRRLPYVPGSRHIEYFTNDEIIDNLASAHGRGFLECDAPGFVRSKTDGKVGAFVITNGSGVSYHFALPAYSSEEYIYSQNKDTREKISFNNLEQHGKYAYTWYLTGVTGPDYVDRGPNGDADGMMNEYDWGYWVSFQYGKWTDEYRWRNPALGFNDDLDTRFQSFSKGKKELYYLNSIRTATHTAFFVKELRADGKGESPQEDVSVRTVTGPSVAYVDEGSFSPAKRTITIGGNNPNLPSYDKVEYTLLPVSTLKLNSILLFKNEDIASASYNNLNSEYNDTFSYDWLKSTEKKIWTTHYGENVLDVYDIQSTTFPTGKALRTIDLSYDYSLSPETPNSFDELGTLYDCEGCDNYHPANTPQTKLGKLTLKSVSFKGKNSASLIPPIYFAYDYTDPSSGYGTVAAVNASTKICTLSNFQYEPFQVGDIVKLTQGENVYYGFIRKNQASAEVKIFSDNLPFIGNRIQAVQTKNPPYNKDCYDMWTYFKGDYTKTDDPNMDRFPTESSGKNVDAWSLRRIETSTGASINIVYESDTYGKSILSENLTIPLHLSGNTTETTPPTVPGNATTVFLEASLDELAPVDFSKIYKVGDFVDLAGGGYGCNTVPGPPGTTGDQQQCGNYLINQAEVQQVSSKYIRMRFYIGYESFQAIHGCVINLKSRDIQWGGGLRVKSISLEDPTTNTRRSTVYEYEFDNKSSGVTSYEPLKINNISAYITNNATTDAYIKGYLLRPFIKMMTLARDVPAPAVYYSKVRVKEIFTNGDNASETIPGYSEFEFQTFDTGLIDMTSIAPTSTSANGTYRGQNYNSISKSKRVLRDFTSRIGALKSITLFDAHGERIAQTLNHYLHDEQTDLSFEGNSEQYGTLLNRYNNQGQIDEVFNHGRLVNFSSESNVLQGLVTKRETYPAVQTGATSINYKTGIRTTSIVKAFDFYSGVTTQSLTTDGYGNSFLTVSTPAYHVYPALGLKMFYQASQQSNKHMIEQSGANYVYKVNAADQTKSGLHSASVQTWSNAIPVISPENDQVYINQSQVWRKYASFNFIGQDYVALQNDGLYPVASVTEFTAWNRGQDTPAGWQKNGEVSLYDFYSHPLEATDVNKNYAATRMMSDHWRVIATAAPARYTEFAYTGAEDFANGNYSGSAIQKLDGTITNTYKHTGDKSLAIPANGASCQSNLKLESKRYDFKMHISFWLHASSVQPITWRYQLNTASSLGTPQSIPVDMTKAKRSGNWWLCEIDLPISKNTTDPTIDLTSKIINNGSQAIYIDDYRIHPAESSMVSYVYNQWDELSYILNNNNIYTFYEYDDVGRLTSTTTESFQRAYGNEGVVKLADIDYNYGKGKSYSVPITSNSSGNSGLIYPSGVLVAEQGTDVSFTIQEHCNSNNLLSISIDNKVLNLSQSETILFDGTKVIVSGNKITLVNVLTQHTVVAQFTNYTGGVVECHLAQSTTGPCYDGSYDYRFYNACGQLGDKIRVWNVSDIPPDLRPLAPSNCTSLNSGGGCGTIIED